MYNLFYSLQPFYVAGIIGDLGFQKAKYLPKVTRFNLEFRATWLQPMLLSTTEKFIYVNKFQWNKTNWHPQTKTECFFQKHNSKDLQVSPT